MSTILQLSARQELFVLKSIKRRSFGGHIHDAQKNTQARFLIPRSEFAGYSTTSRVRERTESLRLSSILRDAANRRDGTRSGESTVAWLQKRGYSPEDLERWRRLIEAPSAELALIHTTAQMPIYVVLRTLRKRAHSRKTFYKLVCIYRQAAARMDESSHFYAVCILLKRALQLNKNVLSLLTTDIVSLPSFYGSYHFNHLLEILSSGTIAISHTSSTQIMLVEQMQLRGAHINANGYRALLAGYAHDPVRSAQIERQMAQAGYGPDGNLQGHGSRSELDKLDEREKWLDGLAMNLRNAKTITDLSACIEWFPGERRDSRVWRLVLNLYHNRSQAIVMCLQYIETDQLPMTTYLTGVLLQACRSSDKQTTRIDEICQLAISKSVTFNTFVWLEYLKRIVWAGRAGEAATILACEPGGNHLLDMDPRVRRDPRIWHVVIQTLNRQVERGLLSGQKHARYMGILMRGWKQFDIGFTPSLVWCILEAAINSGSRSWAKKHSCDAVVTLFDQEVDTNGTEPWKLPGSELLWHSYMKVLLANEETALLSEAMTRLLSTGQPPTRKLLKIFALGIWESGNIELLEYWRKYFEEVVEVDWPTADAVFATRQALKLQKFYE